MLMELMIGLALADLQPLLDHPPFGAVDHHRHAGDIGLGGDQAEEALHRRFGIEQALVHVDVDDLGAVFDLGAGDIERGFVIVGRDQFAELGRAGDVGALADIDEIGLGRERERLQARRGADNSASRGRRGAMPFTASPKAFRCSGVVPQQPPTILSEAGAWRIP